MSYRWKADIFSSGQWGCYSQNVTSIFTLLHNQHPPQIKFNVAFISSPQLRTYCPGLLNADRNDSLCLQRAQGVCTRVCVSCVSMSVCRRLSSSGTHPRSFGLLSSNFSKFPIGTKKGGESYRTEYCDFTCSWSKYSEIKIKSLCCCGTLYRMGLFGKIQQVSADYKRCSGQTTSLGLLQRDVCVLGWEICVYWKLCQFNIHPICSPLCLNAAKGPTFS